MTKESPYNRKKRLNRFVNFWIEPTSAVAEPGDRQNARLLATFLLALFLLFLFVKVIYALTIPGYRLAQADMLGYISILLAYSLSRTRFNQFAAIIMILMFPMNIFSSILGGSSHNPAVTLSFILPSLVLASIWFPMWGLAIYGAANTLGVALLPLLVPNLIPDFSVVVGPISLTLVTVVVVMITKNHRNKVEEARRAELESAYDTTLAGWSRALEIRDKETEGHSNRVTEMTLRLARVMEIDGEELEHIHRGALLHDIGKMGTPDSILLKPSKLTEEEFEVIKQHPILAHQLISPIPFLRSAIQIPYCHHEKWDGSGYPQGLKGEKIPLSARIFAIIDVWDALLSDRPYRAAWPEDKVMDYLKFQRGKYFDPKVLDKFFELV